MEQSRFRSPVLWAALCAQLLAILLTVGAIDTGMGQMIEQVAAGVLQMLTLVGVLNNPTDSMRF